MPASVSGYFVLCGSEITASTALNARPQLHAHTLRVFFATARPSLTQQRGMSGLAYLYLRERCNILAIMLAMQFGILFAVPSRQQRRCSQSIARAIRGWPRKQELSSRGKYHSLLTAEIVLPERALG